MFFMPPTLQKRYTLALNRFLGVFVYSNIRAHSLIKRRAVLRNFSGACHAIRVKKWQARVAHREAERAQAYLATRISNSVVVKKVFGLIDRIFFSFLWNFDFSIG